jgi:hypothetical protein
MKKDTICRSFPITGFVGGQPDLHNRCELKLVLVQFPDGNCIFPGNLLNDRCVHPGAIFAFCRSGEPGAGKTGKGSSEWLTQAILARAFLGKL